MEPLTFYKTIDECRQGEAFTAKEKVNGRGKKFYIESYGCQMNFSDSEIVASILMDKGFQPSAEHRDADLVLINTCAIRDNAEQRVRHRLKEFSIMKRQKPDALVGILGCMAERLKEKLLEEEKLVDIVIGPDAYRDLPRLIEEAETGQKAVNVLLSREETYADVNPVRLNSNGVTAFITIMRGCDNMCSFCVVPFTRGRERSRNPQSIVKEARQLFEQGYREVTLLGQNVDSYHWSPRFSSKKEIHKALSAGESPGGDCTFSQLLEKVAQIHPGLRVRFSTSNPRDMTDDVLHTIARYDNICKHIHLPVQSGSSRILEKMNRGHNREWYLQRIEAIRRIIPGCGITTDIITGFCSETEEDHHETLSLMQEVNYDWAFMFHYSERPGTLAERRYEDDVPLETKKRRLNEVIALQQRLSYESNKRDIGKTFTVLAEGVSKKSERQLFGRNSQNKAVVFERKNFKPGDYVNVKVTDCTAATLAGVAE
ncbi:MAG TPA: tRNA (N6-isopentenyl adenosine(37)-C2)-methylthiotransferase MiaB [Chitinophagales bacterium]|nr:tRNA (N6-isopentenyl adenosine(37)-C2)-methylthiotransferase MiaB [Chitinophagales bacterium]